MNVYVDSSVLLRIVLGERGALREWRGIRRAVSSELTRVECLRTIDRARIRFGLADTEVSARREAVLHWLEQLDLVRLGEAVCERASQPFPTMVGSLDALHLASALLARPRFPAMKFATHDVELATAARAVGFTVLGAARA